MTEGGATLADRITYAFRLATARKPDAEELRLVEEIFQKQVATYRKDPSAADKLLDVGSYEPSASLDKSELAAWTTVASMLLNLDETVTKG
jgi:hypothetical protein